jgi:ABC-type tungstate transport system substrate-binding protein
MLPERLSGASGHPLITFGRILLEATLRLFVGTATHFETRHFHTARLLETYRDRIGRTTAGPCMLPGEVRLTATLPRFLAPPFFTTSFV